MKFSPKIIKTKEIDKRKDLKVIRNKLENNIELTAYECSMLISFPIFELDENESEIVEEMCKYIKHKSQCIPDDEVNGIIIAMYLNIIEYIEPEKQERLMEMIDVESKTEGIIAEIRNQGINQGEKNILLELLKSFSIREVSEIVNKDIDEIWKILE